ncbi:MAG: phosphoribosylanthranilate isomerase [Nevskiales bacterium]
MRTRIKICGITRLEDAHSAVNLGADALGFVFYPPSSRALPASQAAEIAKTLPAFITKVALFLDPEPEDVQQVVEVLQPELLQFHGRETADFCSLFGKPYIKSLGLGDEAIDITAEITAHAQAQAFLLDSHKAGQAGGSGKTFDWQAVPKSLHRPLILAGGLDASNVRQAIQLVRPYAVDVSSGVESAPGIKDAQKLREFVEQVRMADVE